MISKTPSQYHLPMPPSQVAYHHVGRVVQMLAWRMRKYITRKNALIVSIASVSLLAVVYATAFFWPHTTSFSYTGNNCFTNPVLLPRLVSASKNPSYAITTQASFSVAGYPLYAHTACITPTKLLKEHASEVIPFGIGPFTKDIRVSTGAYPSITNQEMLKGPVATQDPLVLSLTSGDTFFDYILAANDKSTQCQKQDVSVICDVAKLSLAQSVTYDFKLTRLYNGKPAGTLFERSIATVESVHIASSSVAANQTIYDIPTEFTLTLTRPAVAIQGAKLHLITGDSRAEVPITTALKENMITVHLSQPLVRSASFVFSIEHLTAADGGFLPSPYSLPFKTSGGPKVLGLNISSYKVAQNSTITLTFDSAVSKAQNLQNFIKLEVAGSAVATTLSAGTNTITIKPAASLPRCTALTVKVLDGLQNTAGITGGTAWQFKSRTICQSVFSIGTSVQGRSINAYSFGSGPSKIIFVGTTHGNEKSSTYLLNKWIDSLEANYDRIPAGRTIIVVPNINPDGYAINQRTNAHNVDLNRNFPANDWKSGVSMPDGSYLPSGGGTAPLSEPETAAIANYVLSQNPRLVLTYHAAGAIVSPNDSGDSNAIALAYAQKSSVGFLSNSGTGSFFDYDTTGAFEAWLHDKHSIPTLLIELITKTGDEFSGHTNALWYVAQLP
jgi:hypothetical protein